MKQQVLPAIVLGVTFLLFVAAPFIPNAALKATVGNPVGTVVLLGAALAALKVNMALGIAAFLAAGALFLENRKRLVAKLRVVEESASASAASGKRESTPADVARLSVPAPDLVDGEVHPAAEEPSTEDHAFAPQQASEAFEAVGPSINQKMPLQSGTPPSAAAAAAQFTRAGL